MKIVKFLLVVLSSSWILVCICKLTILYTCVSGIYMCVCLLFSYVVKQWPTYVGQAKTEAPVVTKFGLDDVQNDIQTKYVLTLVLEYEICAAGARVVKTMRQNQP